MLVMDLPTCIGLNFQLDFLCVMSVTCSVSMCMHVCLCVCVSVCVCGLVAERMRKIIRCAVVSTYVYMYAIEMYWNMRNKHSEKTTGQILAV